MALTKFDIVKTPIITPKSVELYRELGQYTFQVHKKANKIMVKDAVKRLWDVDVEKVRIVNLPAKLKTANRRSFMSPGKKKAIVTLKKGYSIEIPGLFETMATQQPAAEKAQVEGK